ncbi:tellurite resistance/C4-dicarboxylate transporter family protein [Paenarthrobacter sp. Z7-10]|uniref:tellurite resistance/C4-dicarboxylate transporter family protein n=1 Tax=Paenarthrobacter sp. Z7-10 TaxID=2787635 RepID=UPI0022A95B79|nr:tellurite resistance/C4-dicarboxylate transporter family protein [Paenarthrobacter sp. Z7-10]
MPAPATGGAGPSAVGRLVRSLPTGSFAFVMATGIVSTAFQDIGSPVESAALLVIAATALVFLSIAAIWRFIAYRPETMREAADPAKMFGLFTIVAALNVVGVRFYSPAAAAVTIALGLISVPLWLLFNYGLPASLFFRPRTGSAVAEADGSWFLWVVATQSLATASANLARGFDSQGLAALAVALWGIGVLLYLMLATIVTLKLLTVPGDPKSLNPSYWIYMGATAITVLAGATILALPAELPAIRAMLPLVSGLTFILWAFGAWWIPLLVTFGVWRHIVQHQPLHYELGLFSIVFPLGMYSVASLHFGAIARMPLLVDIGEVGTWIAALAWLAVVVALVHSTIGRLRANSSR